MPSEGHDLAGWRHAPGRPVYEGCVQCAPTIVRLVDRVAELEARLERAGTKISATGVEVGPRITPED